VDMFVPRGLMARVLCVGILHLLLSEAVFATGTDAQGVDIQIAHPTPFFDMGVMNDDAVAGEQWSYGAEFLLHYMHNPLIWKNPDDTRTIAVSGLLYGEVLAQVTFLRWLQGGIALPIALDFFANDLRGLTPAPAAGLGDLRLALKAQFLREQQHVISMALIAELGLPTAAGRAYEGSSTVTGSPRLVISKRFGSVEIAADIGARIRGERSLPGIPVGSQLSYGANARWDTPWPFLNTSLALIGEIWGLTPAKHPFAHETENIFEYLASVRVGVLNKIWITASGGGGLIPGYGSPDFRGLIGIAWAPREGDRDFDGIPDSIDKCPDEPENYNGYQDDDGCPDTKPITPKTEQVKPLVGDRDHDGIPDDVDQCPDEPETINGYKDDDGCPDEGEGATVFVTKQEIKILQQIHFETAKAIIKPESYTIVDQVASQLRAHPEVKRLRIEGHTDSVGGVEYNLRLSQARANSVKTYLLNKGIDEQRLQAVGYGKSRPIATNATVQGRALNRRVQFVILESEE